MRVTLRSLATTIPLLVLAGPVAAQPSGPDGHLPFPPSELERRLRLDAFEIDSVKGAGGGVTGAKKLELEFEDDVELKVKWKPVPSGGDGWNNSPRRELAAYVIQKWFLEPDDYVVPPHVARCIPFDVYEEIQEDAGPNVPPFRCVLGIFAVWLDNVTVPDDLYEEERFLGDPTYAAHIADMNLLAYLIKHQDGRKGNFLTSEDEGNRHVFAVDNGISFGVLVHNWFVRNWHKIRVPALRAEAIEKLRAVGQPELDALGVLAELRADDTGVLRWAPPGENADPTKGVRVGSDSFQFGLTRSEIENVRRRIVKLLARVDAGDLDTF